MNQWASKLTSEILDNSPMLSKGGICGDLKVGVQPLIAVYTLVTKPRMLLSMDEHRKIPLADSQEAVVSAAHMRKSSSNDAKLSKFRKIQTSRRKDAVYNNRPLSLSCPPIRAYRPVFARFRSKMALPLETFQFTSE